MCCWISHKHRKVKRRARCKQKVFCCEMIHSALAINYFGQDDWLLGIVACCIDSQWKVPNSSYFSIISVITALLLLCRALLLVSKHLMLGVVGRSPHPGKESSPRPCSFQKWLLFFFLPLVARGPFCCLSAHDRYAQHQESILDNPIPAWLRFFGCCCLCCLGYQAISAAASPFLHFSKFCYYPLL